MFLCNNIDCDNMPRQLVNFLYLRESDIMKKRSSAKNCAFFAVCISGIAIECIEAAPDKASTSTAAKREKESQKECSKKKDKRGGASKYSGAYVGAGLSFRSISRKMNISDNWKEVAERHGNTDQKDRHLKIFDKKGESVGCSLVAGIGKIFNDVFYVGGELLLDIGGANKKKQDSKYTFYSIEDDEYGNLTQTEISKNYDSVESKSRNVVPVLVGRFGCYVEPIDSLICLRAGCAFLGTEFKSKKLDKTIKRDAVPVIGMDFEKSFCCGTGGSWNIRVSADYCFYSSKNKRYERTEKMGTEPTVVDICKTDCKAKVGGYMLRVICTYNFNIF